jgi:hypothetical protein
LSQPTDLPLHHAVDHGPASWKGCVVIEVKALEELARIHAVQLLSHLKLTGCTVGLLIDFHAYVLRDGIRRVVHGYPDPLRSLRSRRSSAPSALKGRWP